MLSLAVAGCRGLSQYLCKLNPTVIRGGSKQWTFSETMDIRDFTVCIIHCVYRAELILGT